MNRGERVNILVVDDNAENRLSLEAILSEPGQNVVTAASGRDALRRLLEQEFAVILLDVKMPVMDGFETAALVRQRKSSERTPIIFITAFSDDIHIARGYSLGAVDYIVSPVVPEVLRSKVAVFVELFRKTEQIRHQAESLRRRADQLYHLTEASLAINSVNSLGEILEIVTETARDLLAPRCALTTTSLDQAQRPQRLNVLEIVAEDGAKECDHQRFTAQAAAMTAALADQGRTVLLTPREVASDPRWRFLRESDEGNEGDEREEAKEGDAGAPRPPRVGNGAAESGWLAAPLTGRDGRCFGWVHLAGRAREEIGEFGDEDKTILTQLAQVASIAIENCLSSEA
ncbi:MAG TPA: response regulator, partial [Thermoanaerobaculia bacterium]|nr:response regulator [Thermoanaerobaculia bacterium]